MVKVLFFARLRQKFGKGEVHIDNFSGSVQSLRELLSERYPEWRSTLGGGDVRVAVNQTLAGDDALVVAGDEVAFFPPVTGG